MHVTEAVTTRRGPSAGERSSDMNSMSATRVVVSTFGAVVAFAGLEHGIGEILQGPVAPRGLAIESWPSVGAFEVLAGEPAMTVIPNLLLTGVLAVVVALTVGVWSVAFVERRYGGLVLIGLSVLLLLVGGGFAPPLIGIILGVAATRIGAASRRAPGRAAQALAPLWPRILGAGALAFLGLVPGVPMLNWLFGVSDSNLVLGLTVVAFAALLVAPLAARAHDRLHAGRLAALGPDTASR
jgi:hypothetical protein